MTTGTHVVVVLDQTGGWADVLGSFPSRGEAGIFRRQLLGRPAAAATSASLPALSSSPHCCRRRPTSTPAPRSERSCPRDRSTAN